MVIIEAGERTMAEPEANKEGERSGLRKVFPEEILAMQILTANQWCAGKWFIDSSMLKK